MDLNKAIATKGAVLLVVGALAFSARKRGRSSLFDRLIQPSSSPPASLDPDLSDALEREVRTLLAQGRKIEAVKRVRRATGWGLKEAKDYVDNLL